ncbi:MAG: YCF48-related protein [Caldimonas sp.]
MTSTRGPRSSSLCRLFVAGAIALLTACGGGGGAGVDAPLPAALVLTAPTTAQPLGSAVAFSASAIDPALVYRWDFGDGTSSALSAPSHTYARAGVYTVRLVVGNGSGSLSASATVAVSDFAIVAGKACSAAANGGWCWQRPLPQGDALLDYAFVNDTHGWAVGEGGTVLATVDGGTTWTAQFSGTPLSLGQVKFVSTLVGWATSENGELIKTADCGATWRRVSFGRNDSVQLLGVTDATTAWVATFNGEARVTTDGGDHWRQIPPPPGGAFRVLPVSATDIWALEPFFQAQPQVQHSIDGGATWATVALPPIEPGLSGYSQDLQFSDPSHALLIGFESGIALADPTTYISRQTLRLTADRGASWQSVAPPPLGQFPNYSLAGTNTVFAFGFGTPPQRTQDNGATWQTIALPAVANFYPAGFIAYTPQRLLAVDGNGLAYLSTDGGATWAQRSARGAQAFAINSLWFFDSRDGLALSDDGSALRTGDGGVTWSPAAGSGGVGWRRPQFLADGSLGWVISDSGAIWRSTDRGRTWLAPAGAAATALVGVTDFHFVDALHGWAIRPYGDIVNGATVFVSDDGGLSWRGISGTASSLGFEALRFADLLHGAAVGPAGIALVTSDGGATWSPRPTGITFPLRRVTFVDASTVVAVGYGGAVARSTDSGRTWQQVDVPTGQSLNDVRFVGNVGHAVGDRGTDLVSRDGGATWTLQPTGSQAWLRTTFFVDEQTGWTAGGNGSILATATGGR